MEETIRKTVFITGASKGIGMETALLFARNGWNVAATMRNPRGVQALREEKNVTIISCDVTDQGSIENAVQTCIRKYGRIDVLINNAGFYTIGPFEAATNEQIDRQMNTNLKGMMLVTREILPYMRKQNSGVIINLSSIAGRISIPMQTLYHATKWGVEGFSESLQYELAQFHIRVKLIEPGVINTDFYGGSKTVMKNSDLSVYDDYADTVVGNLLKNGQQGSLPSKTAKTIYQAATDGKNKMRYRTGKSKGMPFLRSLLPLRLYMKLVDSSMTAHN